MNVGVLSAKLVMCLLHPKHIEGIDMLARDKRLLIKHLLYMHSDSF